MDCSRSSRSASGQINLRCLASSCAAPAGSRGRADLDGFLALWRVHPLKESIEERVIREDTVLRLFRALLAHEVLKQVWAVAARFVLAGARAPGYPLCRQGAGILVASDSRNAARLVVSR